MKVFCRACQGTNRDAFDGGSCLWCHTLGYENISIFEMWKYNRLVKKYGEPNDRIRIFKEKSK